MPSSSRNTRATELLKKVRKIEIKTKALSHQIFAGEYHSAFKGRGMAFSEVHEYQYGDDIRNIDWNVTARFNKPFVKKQHPKLDRKPVENIVIEEVEPAKKPAAKKTVKKAAVKKPVIRKSKAKTEAKPSEKKAEELDQSCSTGTRV